MQLPEPEQFRAVDATPLSADPDVLRQLCHELRTPLNAILGNAELMSLCGQNLDVRQKDQLASIRTGGLRLLRVIERLTGVAPACGHDDPASDHPCGAAARH